MFSNLKELLASMPDDATCRKYLVEQRWPDGKITCPYCGHNKVYTLKGGIKYKCAARTCYQVFSATVGTIMQDSNMPLDKWFMAIFLITGHKKGISSCQLARDMGITQKSAWFMLHRVREMMFIKAPEKLSTIVEVDETYVGGKMKNKHKSVRVQAHADNISHVDNKTGVMGYLQREGDLKLRKMDRSKTLKEQVKENVAPEAVIITDGLNAYTGLAKDYEAHEVVDHAADEYVKGIFHTNSVEGSFGLFKRMIIGIYHQISPKHLDRYCDEFTYRYNSRKINDADRFTLSLQKIEGRLDYKTLTGKK